MFAKQIQEIVSSYLSSGNADKFVREFSAASYNVHKNADPEAIALVSRIEGEMADLHSGFILQDAFKKHLFELMAGSPRPAQEPLVVVYSNSGRILPQQSNTSNGPQNAQLRPIAPKQPMLPVVLDLVGSH